jgi:hypothetical protein
LESILLQDWVTLSTSATATTITQGADSWLDVGAFEDLVFYLDVKLASGSPVINYQTAPVPEEASFTALLPGINMATGVTTNSVLAVFAGVPVARFLRWQLTGTSAYATFRIWVSAYSLG